MGQDKAELTLPDGMRFLDHAILRAQQVADEVCLVGGNRYHANCRVVADSLPHRGPAAGVVTALQIARSESFDACLVTPVDMPLLSIDDLCKLKEAWLQQPHLPVCGVCDEDGRIQPLAAIYPVASLPQLLQTAESENRSLAGWLRSHRHCEVALPANSCRNINTPDDLSPPLPAT
jgi:molybdopterin-guanine dinucleotide biosynthesis protein A